jgi:enoyl-CoA hydratase
MSELVHLDKDGSVGVIRLDRPPVNAINRAMHGEIVAAAVAADADPGIRAVVVRGSQKAFAAGADIKEMADMGPQEIAVYGRSLATACDAVARIRKPVIAAVTGYALGGGLELALAADFRVVGESAQLGLPEITLGVIPGAGGTQRLPRLVGVTKAKEMIFSGRPVNADTALGLGLASRKVPDEAVFDEALSWAGQLAAGATVAIGLAKQAIDDGLDSDLAGGLRIEGLAFSAVFASDDQRIGMHSFIENGPGKAVFTGH